MDPNDLIAAKEKRKRARMTTSLTAPLAVAGGLPGFPSLRMGAEINHGYFGRVYRAFDPKEQRDFAIKVVEKTRLNEKQRQNVRNEVTYQQTPLKRPMR